MGPRKKTPTMKWVVKSQQSTKMTEPAMEKKKTSSSMIMPDSSLVPDFVSKLHMSSSPPSAKMAQPEAKEHTLSEPDWSLLPEELLHIISEKLKLEDCFDVIHARSVCRPWRSSFPFPSCLFSTRYSLPAFAKFPRKRRGLCTLEKFPMFLFRVRSPAAAADPLPSEFYVGGINQGKSEDCIELPSPIQCSVKVKMGESDPTLMSVLDCQILPLGYQYRMIGYDPQSLATSFRGVAFLPLSKEGGEFVVLIGYSHDFLALRSTEMKWMRVEKPSKGGCKDIVTFRGKFYAVFINGDVCVIDPYSLEATSLMPSERLTSNNYLVPAGNDELFLVERIYSRYTALYLSKLACRVSRLDEEAGEWVVVSDLGDRVLFIGQPGNSSCSAKELPDGCGVSGNSMLFINDLFGVTFSYKYGVDTGNPEDDLSFWRSFRETRLTIVSKSPMAAHLRVEQYSSSSPGLGEAHIGPVC
uniref:F-box/kelch-repeat protein n=1 Tax=Noccaea caerulescens TaxID=107243 RepID=A0A1J3K3Z4_NOCCA